MRVILAAAAALAVVTVSGCDINTGPAKTAKVECNCAVPPQPPAGMRGSTAYTVPAEHYRYREHGGRRYAHGAPVWSSHSYHWRREYAEMSVATYDYHSTSHSYDMGGGGGGDSGGVSAYAYAAAGGGAAFAGAGVHGGGGSYVGDAVHGGDGYHAVPQGPIDDHGRGGGGGSGARQDPWHGYDIDCPDRR